MGICDSAQSTARSSLFFIYLSLLLCMNEQLTINLAFVYASNTYEVILCLMSHFANEGNLSNMSHPLPQNFPCFMLKQNRASDKKKKKKSLCIYGTGEYYLSVIY